ncbi:hypothetical protein GS982_21240 [Rhodococcus hoagii]|nr:hypothetical protein [Prescottella equi]NKZ84613.1 hypothetical protein [Prescottella equi]NKZ84711.1 hypothetical protein [Prescottella equi]
MTTLTRPRFTGTWEPDEDVATADLEPRRRADSVSFARPNSVADRIPDWIEDARFLVASGITEAGLIAKRIGCTAGTYLEHVAPHVDIPRPLNDRRAAESLERLIASGDTFDMGAVPSPDSDHYLQGLVNTAVAQARITKVGYERHTSRTFWRGTTPDEQAAILAERAVETEKKQKAAAERRLTKDRARRAAAAKKRDQAVADARRAAEAARLAAEAEAAGGRIEKVEKVTHCILCERPVVYDRDLPEGAELPEGAVRHNSRGRCNACTLKQNRERARNGEPSEYQASVEVAAQLFAQARPIRHIAKAVGRDEKTVRRWRDKGLLAAA